MNRKAYKFIAEYVYYNHVTGETKVNTEDLLRDISKADVVTGGILLDYFGWFKEAQKVAEDNLVPFNDYIIEIANKERREAVAFYLDRCF